MHRPFPHSPRRPSLPTVARRLTVALVAFTLLATGLGLPAPARAQAPAEPQAQPEASAPTQPAAQPSTRAHRIDDRELFGKSLVIAHKALEAWGTYDDPEARRRVADIGYRVARHSGYDGMPLSFYVVDMAAPNAFALPGGQIFITRGMLELDLTDDMLAALLGHEIGHVALDHHGRMQKKATLMNVLSQALLVGVMIASADQDRDPYDVYDRRRPQNPHTPMAQEPTQGQVVYGAAAASVVLGEMLLRGYSRDHEDEADEEGQRWATAAGFSPQGTQRLMEHMSSRLPQKHEYGYLQTHPFMDDRAKAARARAEYLKVQEPKPDAEYRQATQEALLSFLTPAARARQGAQLGPVPTDLDDLEPEVLDTLRRAALTAWPVGAKAEELRLEQLVDLRHEQEEKLSAARDYGAVIRAYQEERSEVEALDPESPLVARLAQDIAELEAERDQLYPRAQEILEGGVYETTFLEIFESNWPEAPETPRVALALGDAYSRLGQTTEAVDQYIRAWEAAPDSEPGQRARLGLTNLAPALEELAALQRLAEQEDPELAEAARERLAARASRYEELANGAEYLGRFPDGPHTETVTDRLNALAEKRYNEIILYRAVGDSLKALERVQEILTYAPLSPAAERLREQAVLDEAEPAAG